MQYINGWKAAFWPVVLAVALGGKAQDTETVDLRQLPANAVRPQVISQVQPVYPPGMSHAGLTGQVMLEFIIDREGRVVNPVVVASNNPWFERPAITAVLKWRFKPGRILDRKINVRVSQLIVFELEGGSGEPLWLMNQPNKAGLAPELRVAKNPVPVNTAFPVYPFAALSAGQKGNAKVSCIIDAKGRVIEARVDEASAPEFGSAALAMLEVWKFEPARNKDGAVIPTTFGMERKFSPTGFGDVPVSDQARDILHWIKSKPERIISARELDIPPKPQSRRPPTYPAALAMRGREGQAVIEFYIDEAGDVQLPAIISTTAPEFGYAAAQAVATWRFDPPLKNGKPVIARVSVPIDFNLPGKK